MLARDVRSAVRRAVVDDEDVRVGEPGFQIVEHCREVLLLVPRRDEDDGVAHARTTSASSAFAARSWRLQAVAAPSSHTSAPTLRRVRATRSSTAMP